MARDAQLQAAVVAAQPVLGLVQHHEGAAARAVADPAARLAADHGRIAAPVQEQQRLFAPFQAQAQRRHQRRRQAVLGLVALHVEQGHARQHGVAHGALAQFKLAVAARARVVPAFERGRGRSQHDGDGQLARAPHGQVARRVAQAFLLLVRGVVLLVDDDHLQLRQRGQDGQARAQHDARAALVGGQPMQHALAFGQAAVQGGQHHAGKARADIALELGREVDLGDQDQDLALGFAREHARASLQVDLGLAAARDAVQQHGREAGRRTDGVGRALLGRVQLRHVDGAGVMRGVGLGQLLDGAVERHGGPHAQVLGQAGQRHLAQRTLVVVGREADQRQPVA